MAALAKRARTVRGVERQTRLDGFIKRLDGGQVAEQHGRTRVGWIGIRALFEWLDCRLLGILHYRGELRGAITRVFQALFPCFERCGAGGGKRLAG